MYILKFESFKDRNFSVSEQGFWDCSKGKSRVAIFTDLERKEKVWITLQGADASISWKEGQLAIADLSYGLDSVPWEIHYNSVSIKPLDAMVKDEVLKDQPNKLTSADSKYGGIKSEFSISWIGEPYFENKENEISGFRARRDLILIIPSEQVNDEIFCSLFDENALLPLKEQDVIEATLSFQAYVWDGVGHQTVYVSDVKKVD